MSFPTYPAYKDSGVEWLGEVPEHWVLSPLKYLALLNPKKSSYDGDVESLCSFVPMEKLKTGVVQLDEERRITDVIAGYTYFEDGDVLQAKVTPCFENKNVAIANGLKNGIGFGSSEINVLRPYKSFSAGYLYYRVQEDGYMNFCTASMIGAGGLKRVPTDVINNFMIAAPGFSEQTQIARFLDHETARIDALIEEQQRLIELLKEKRQAVISHAVTKGLDPTVPMKDSGVEWLGEVPAHWEVWKLSHAFDGIGSGTTPPSTEHGWYEGGTIPWITTSELRENVITATKKNVTAEALEKFSALQMHPPGSLAIAMYGATIGRLGILGISATTNQACCVLSSPRSLTPGFTFYWLSGFKEIIISLYATGGGQPNINQDTVASLKVPAPGIEEQRGISDFLDQKAIEHDSLVKEAERVVAFLQERRSALISAAVTGMIDVRNW